MHITQGIIFRGFWAIYWTKVQFSLKETSISSVVMYSLKLNDFWLLAIKHVNTSQIGASLSFALCSAPVFMSSNLSDLGKNLN